MAEIEGMIVGNFLIKDLILDKVDTINGLTLEKGYRVEKYIDEDILIGEDMYNDNFE